MLHEERLNVIRSLILTNKRVMSSELREKFGVSDVTIRKDLAILAKEGNIEKIHGGAILKNSDIQPLESILPAFPDHYSKKNFLLNKIVRYALDQIHDGDTIFLGSGRTCCALAKLLGEKKNISVVTNNISAISDLIKCNVKVFLVGGEVATVDNVSYFSSIEKPSQYLESIYVNKAFTSCSGLDMNAGITVNSIISTYMYKAIPSIQRKWFMLVDKEKFNKIGMYKVCSLDSLDCIITNDISEEYALFFKDSNINYVSVC